MKINFITNNYLLIWNLLYGPSISMKMHMFKQKLWLIYKKEYKKIENDKDEILHDHKNFIPDDNTIYDLIEDSSVFPVLIKDVEHHRIKLMKEWDLIKRKVNKELSNILRIESDTYQVIVLHPSMESELSSFNAKSIGWGKKADLEDSFVTILKMITLILKEKVHYQDNTDEDIKNAILELAVENEVYTRIRESNYFGKNQELLSIKKDLYPYFLMYLGINLEDTTPYMMRDNMAFDIEKYTNEIQLRNLDIFEFIDFVVRNKKLLLKNKKELVEVL